MTRCSYTHDIFDRVDGYMCDGTKQCWLTDVGNFGTKESPLYYCIFHAPSQDRPINRSDWTVESRMNDQNVSLMHYLDQWNDANSKLNSESIYDLHQFVLPGLQCGDISFRDYIFSGSIYLNSAIFNGDVRFNAATFHGHTEFSCATFLECPSFWGAVFNNYAVFSSVDFKKGAGFHEVLFSGAAYFDSAKFGDNAVFANIKVGELTKFSNAEFDGCARFECSVFNGTASFNNVKFNGTSTFDHSEFKHGHADFNATLFNDNANINNVKFNGGVYFDSAIFNNSVDFISTKFKEEAYYSSVLFKHDANFEKVVFNNIAMFSDSKFMGSANFINAGFKSILDFSGGIFSLSPLFHNAVLHQGTDFRGRIFSDTGSRNAPLAYRTLKIAMGNIKSRSEEADFYALELDSIRNQPDTRLSIKLFSYMYKQVSNYGRSIARPLVWLLCVSLIFIFIYGVQAHENNNFINEYDDILRFTIQQLVRPFYIWSSSGVNYIGEVFHDGTFKYQLIATLQSLISLSIIALFLLAVRRRFRLS